MVSKIMRFCLITIVIINIIFFIFALENDSILEMNKLISDFFETFKIFIYFYSNFTFSMVDADIFYNIILIFCIAVNILFLNIIFKNKYRKVIYFLYIMTTILFIQSYYLLIAWNIIFYIIKTGEYLSVLDVFTGNNFFYHIVFFLEVILPIMYFKNYKSMLKNKNRFTDEK